jgi:magnesium-transporting ATPase (P-type)
VSDEHSEESIRVQAAPFASEGLTSQEATLRRKQYGPNLLPRPPHLPLWRRLLSQLIHFFGVMLWSYNPRW